MGNIIKNKEILKIQYAKNQCTFLYRKYFRYQRFYNLIILSVYEFLYNITSYNGKKNIEKYIKYLDFFSLDVKKHKRYLEKRIKNDKELLDFERKELYEKLDIIVKGW